MLICRYTWKDSQVRIGLITDRGRVLDLSSAGIASLTELLDDPEPVSRLRALNWSALLVHPRREVQLLAPIEQQEVWAAGVTYLRSKTARMTESEFSATAYGRVYEAERPELFFKSLPEKVVGPGQEVGIRGDARWSVPEPELALVINAKGAIVGVTLGNDMSARDLEGENLLYLPQAKIYRGSCALGPAIKVDVSEAEVRGWQIRLRIRRQRKIVFEGTTCIGRIRRPFAELADYLYRCQEMPRGAMLLTGTGIVPPDDFTLAPKDRIIIEIPALGRLENQVRRI